MDGERGGIARRVERASDTVDKIGLKGISEEQNGASGRRNQRLDTIERWKSEGTLRIRMELYIHPLK